MLVEKKVLVRLAEAAGAQAVTKPTDYDSLAKCSFVEFFRLNVPNVRQINSNIGVSEAESGTFLPFNPFL